MVVRKEPEPVFWDIERKLLAPAEHITVSQWSDRHRIVHTGPYTGQRWDTDRTPFLREIMDAYNDRDVQEVTLIKGVQVGGTDILLNVLAYVIDQDPGWVLYVMPRDDDWKHICTDRVRPMVEHSERLLDHVTNSASDLTKGALRFDRSTVFFGAASSARQLASKTCRVVMLDEVDKYPAWSGEEADPISLAKKRTTTLRKRKIYKISTPTTRHGAISVEFEKSDQRRFCIPCPACRHFQHLVWSQVRFPQDVRDPDLLRADPRVAYHCIACDAPISDAQKRAAMKRGVWVPKGAEITPDGKVVGARKTAHRGYHVTGLLSPFRTWGEFVAEWVVQCRSASGLMDFYNSTLGEPFELASDTTEEGHLEKLRQPYLAGVVPDGVISLTAGADVQEHLVYYTIRGWGVGMDSWLIRNGRVDSLEALENILFQTSYKRQHGSDVLRVRKLFIDSQGHHSADVHPWCARWEPVAAAIKGEQKNSTGEPLRPYRPTRGEDGKPVGGTAWHVDTTHYKDWLHRLIHTQAGDSGTWSLHSEVSQEYLSHITAEHRVMKSMKGVKRGKTPAMVWTPKPGARDRNHWLDCEVYALAAADLLGISSLQEVPQPPPQHAPGHGVDRPPSRNQRMFGGPRRRGFGR